MCLRTTDLEVKNITRDCYLTHPSRNEDTDDALLDVANRLEMSRKDLIEWITSPRSWYFIETESDPEEMDFLHEFESLLCA